MCVTVLVSILILLDASLLDKHVRELKLTKAVSILILLDASLLAPANDAYTRTCVGFNPYFTGCFSFRSSACALFLNVCKVSILILLDASLLVGYKKVDGVL